MKNESAFQFSDRVDPDYLGLLARAGYSNTRARRAVLDVLVAAQEPLTPNDLLEAARKRHPALGLVTVYRTLEVLETLDLVRKLHLAEGCHSYVLSTVGLAANDVHGVPAAAGHGHHIICQQCRRAVEFAGCDIEAIMDAVQVQTGFAVRSHWLEVFGLCPSCQEKQR